MDEGNEVKAFVKAVKNGLQVSETEPDIVKWLTIVKSLFVGHGVEIPENVERYGYSPKDMQLFHRIISVFQVKQIYQLLLSKFSIEWITTLGPKNYKLLVKPVFLQAYTKDSFIALFQASSEAERLDFKCQQCVSLLEEFLTGPRLAKLLQTQSSYTGSQQVSQGSPNLTLDPDQEVLMSFLTSLPVRMANKLRHDNSDKFLPQSYIPLLAFGILDTLDWAHHIVGQGENVSLHFISVLVGKLSSVGYAALLLETLLPHLCIRVRRDYMWCRICERIFSHIPARSQEAFIVPMLRQISWYGLVEKFLGDAVVHNTNLKMLLCTKLMLHRMFIKPKTILQNIIGYVSSFHTRRHLLIEVLLALLRVWGDASSMRHISTEQHLYISRALMVCIGCLNDSEKSANKSELLQLLMPGVQAHLESSDPAVRTLGMVVAKSLTQTVEPTGPTLEFELDPNDPDTQDLLSYKELPEDPGISEAEKSVLKSEVKDKQVEVERGVAAMSIKEKGLNEAAADDSELDSDDDLEPFDMSNDRKIEKTKQPKFIRDCMEGLICNSDEPDRTEICLSAAEALIRKKTDGLDEIAVEFAKILLHMQDTHNFENFQANRFKSLVALTVMCPSEVSKYLTSQFYERNYSIRQRMDILETLASAAQELSSVEKQKPNQQISQGTATAASLSSEMLSWQEVIQRRIERNTRRFARGSSKPEPVPTLNRFAPVAGKFFYPLMCRADQSDPCLDLIGRDALLLFRLLYTLAIILNSSKNIHACTHMGQALLQFTWPLRLHQDNCVRQSVLVATLTVFLVVPAHALISDLSGDVTETKAWLGDVVEQDPDTECQKLAAQALFVLQDQIKKELESSAEGS